MIHQTQLMTSVRDATMWRVMDTTSNGYKTRVYGTIWPQKMQKI